jgi:hypothetical protein
MNSLERNVIFFLRANIQASKSFIDYTKNKHTESLEFLKNISSGCMEKVRVFN